MKTRILTYIIILVGLIFIIGTVIVGKNQSSAENDITQNAMPGFTEITAVPGVSFYVNSSFIDKATAITQVSDNISFQKNQYYSYKNGTDKYLLFNMESLIVAAQKNTDFWIGESNEKEHSLLNASLMNIWFTQGSKKFESVTENNVTVTIANAGVSINSTTYGDFCGKLVNINKDGEEWSLFVGVPGERYDKLSDAAHEGIDTIINTFAFNNNATLLASDIYAISLDGTDEKTKVTTEEEVFTYEETSLNLSNQTNILDKDSEMAYSSTPYNMLSLGDNGILSAFNDRALKYEEPIICPKKIYRGDEAIKIIKDFCDATKEYEYVDCTPGSSWEVVEYDLNYKNCEYDDYVNAKIKGVDGEPLRYRGIKYSARTYDMKYAAYTDGDWERKFYIFYPVPNGCLEYCLEFGERTSVNSQEVSAAYYHIVNDEIVIANMVEPTENTQEQETVNEE